MNKRTQKKNRAAVVKDLPVARLSPEQVTEAANRACGAIGDTRDPWVQEAARRIFKKSWRP